MPSNPQSERTSSATGLHPRSRHGARYDFPALVRACPDLAGFVRPSPTSTDTIDFADPAAVTALNRALLAHHYGVLNWNVPAGALCPPIPGRAEYIHHLADLLGGETKGSIPHGPNVTILDIGTGANCVYPIIGVSEYDWRFIGSDIDPASIAWARTLVSSNPRLVGQIELRLQSSPAAIFDGIVQPGETFAASMCNPPFHASRAEATAGTLRKLRNLGGHREPEPVLNFGGRGNELWCSGGEVGFITRMIRESAARPNLCGWFTTLVSSRDSIPAIQRMLKAVRANDVRVIELAHGQKKSRIIAWRFAASRGRKERALPADEVLR